MRRNINTLFSTLRRLLFILVTVLLVAVNALAEDWRAEDIDRVVAIADVHGAYEAMVETLGNVGILDESLGWAGEDTHLVIVGDLLDRGPRSRDAMDLLMRLEGEAAAAGGKVHVLIGNHESMNLIGDMRYVSKAEYTAFAKEESKGQRDRWFQAWARRTNGDPMLKRQRFDDTFPAGYFALREAFGPEGPYGQWLLQKNIIGVINGTAFVHGGLPPEVADIGLDGINRDLKQDLIDYVKAVAILTEAEVLLPTDNFYDHESIVNKYMVKKLYESPVLHSDGPLWYRGNVACSRIIEEHRLKAALKAIGADRVVVGHTPTPNRKVLQRFDGRIVEVDTGMLNFYYKGSGNALVMEGGELQVFNQAGDDAYQPILHPRNVGARPGNLSADDLQLLLETGEIVSETKDDDTDRTIVRVSDGAHEVSAIFSKRPSKGFYPDVAAYRLDRLIDLDMVPVTALRKVGKNDGSLQFMPDRSSNEAERSASGHGSSAPCPLPTQWETMYVFDVLIYNEGRSLQRMLYERSTWDLMLVEHDRAFKSAKGRPSHLAAVPIKVTDGWRDALMALSDDALNQHFIDVLDKRRLRALGTRRDQLLSE
jgi:hypothetical protein